MIAVGIRCTKDKLDMAVVEGIDRSSASIIEQNVVSPPAGQRGDQLAWVRKEILELLGRHAVDAVAVRVAEAGGLAVSLGRSEVEGVVQEACSSQGVTADRHVAVTIRAAYKAKNNASLSLALQGFPVINDRPQSRRDPVVSAMALLPA